jgi:hypothetical protein
MGWYLDVNWGSVEARLTRLPRWAQQMIRAVAEAELERLSDEADQTSAKPMITERKQFLAATSGKLD